MGKTSRILENGNIVSNRRELFMVSLHDSVFSDVTLDDYTKS